MVRTYGEPPYTVAVIHGGPAAKGSVALAAEEISAVAGTLEPIQSKYTITGLIEELFQQIISNTEAPIVLVGHSWGAWLGILFSEAYPGAVRHLVLVGSGPLEDKYVPQIGKRRMNNLPPDERDEFARLLGKLEQTTISEPEMERLKELLDKSDTYHSRKIERIDKHSLPFDEKMYAAIWNEAKTLRTEGKLIQSVKNVQCPITLIQGEQDPHPASGIIEPMQREGIPLNAFILKHCGHSPFNEEEAYEEFYKIIEDIIAQTDGDRQYG